MCNHTLHPGVTMSPTLTENKRRKPRPAVAGRTFASHTALMQDMREFHMGYHGVLDRLKRAGRLEAPVYHLSRREVGMYEVMFEIEPSLHRYEEDAE